MAPRSTTPLLGTAIKRMLMKKAGTIVPLAENISIVREMKKMILEARMMAIVMLFVVDPEFHESQPNNF